MALFEKGKSGNPGGRPKEGADIRALARTHGTAAIAGLYKIASDKRVSASTRIMAWNSLLDRGYGKPAQALEHSGPDGKSIVFGWEK